VKLLFTEVTILSVFKSLNKTEGVIHVFAGRNNNIIAMKSTSTP
jgi:hypothetical protein